MAHKPSVPLVGAVNLWVRVFVPVPKSKPRKWRENALRATNPIRPITRPDVDNYAKQILDVMTGTYFEDDRQVVDLIVSKFYGEIPHWEIEITEIR
jgi:Holliday junction resolvase RusA-like endonuclease